MCWTRTHTSSELAKIAVATATGASFKRFYHLRKTGALSELFNYVFFRNFFYRTQQQHQKFQQWERGKKLCQFFFASGENLFKNRRWQVDWKNAVRATANWMITAKIEVTSSRKTTTTSEHLIIKSRKKRSEKVKFPEVRENSVHRCWFRLLIDLFIAAHWIIVLSRAFEKYCCVKMTSTDWEQKLIEITPKIYMTAINVKSPHQQPYSDTHKTQKSSEKREQLNRNQINDHHQHQLIAANGTNWSRYAHVRPIQYTKYIPRFFIKIIFFLRFLLLLKNHISCVGRV